MSFEKCYLQIINSLKGVEVVKDFPIGKYSRYKTGGYCDIAIFPKSEEEFKNAVSIVRGICPLEIVGAGTNLLVSDGGFQGAVILTEKMLSTKQSGNLYVAESGVKLSSVIRDLALNSLSGLEFAVGIPASVGGAVCMNAGCYGKSVGDYVRYVVTENGTLTKGDCEFGYRTSRFLKEKTAIIKVCFALNPSEPEVIEEKLKSYSNMRRNPKGKSCGSVFKNEGYFAGRVIDECGLKGYCKGGARVSEEHANFIIASDGATSQNIYDLIKTIKEKVYEKRQIVLSEELVYLGKF
ncbi:MAG: UDP-N-acetylmuramate dehydrogenase [Clostridia bacterium]|nr:UDP-N-acetylmuramate dehydrogenase [Clostridia bacterium]